MINKLENPIAEITAEAITIIIETLLLEIDELDSICANPELNNDDLPI